MIYRNTTDENFEHCAKTMTPPCVEVCATLQPGDVLDQNTINCIQIAAGVALAFSIEKYGKPRFRALASSKPTIWLEDGSWA